MTSTPIPGWAYLLIGASVSGFSKFVESKTPKANLTIFFYIGLIFIAIGISKIVFKYITKDKTEKTPKPLNNQIRQNNNNQKNQTNNWQQPNNMNYQNQRNQTTQNQLNQSGFLHTKNQQMPQNTFTQQENSSTITCPTCGTKHYSYANFCMMCGAIMKRR